MEAVRKTKIDAFFRQYRLESYKKGQVLLLAGENPTHAYYLVRGRVKQYEITGQGREIIVNIFRPNNYFMILTALTGLPNSYYFSAETDISVYRVPIKDTVRYVNNNPDAMKAMLMQAYIGFEGVLRRMTHLMSGNTRGRIIYEILLDARGFGDIQQMGPPPHVLSITATELASRAGLSRETVSRELSHLKKSGLLVRTPKITVANLHLLEEALEESL